MTQLPRGYYYCLRTNAADPYVAIQDKRIHKTMKQLTWYQAKIAYRYLQQTKQFTQKITDNEKKIRRGKHIPGKYNTIPVIVKIPWYFTYTLPYRNYWYVAQFSTIRTKLVANSNYYQNKNLPLPGANASRLFSPQCATRLRELKQNFSTYVCEHRRSAYYSCKY